MTSRTTLIFVLFSISAYSQSTSDTELKLQAAIKEADRQRAIAKANEDRAIKAEYALKHAEAHARNLRYMAIANEIAERSVEIQDKELSAMLAILSLKFNTQHGGTAFNNKVYTALSSALNKYDQPSSNKAGLTPGDDTKNTSAVMPDGRYRVEAEQNGNIRFVSEGGVVVTTLAGHRAQVNQIRFNHGGGLMITAGNDNTIRIWNLKMLNMRPLVITENAAIGNLTVSTDDKQIMYVVAGSPKAIKAQWLDTNEMAAQLCKLLTRNLTKEEWATYVAADLEYENVCANYPPGK